MTAWYSAQMAKEKNASEQNELAATIEAASLSYSLSDHRPTIERVDEEAIMELVAKCPPSAPMAQI